MTLFICDCGLLKKDVSKLNEVMRSLTCPKCGSKLQDKSLPVQTKLESFINLDEHKLSEMRQLIYNELMSNPGTDSEIAHRLGFNDPNKVRPRRFELKDMGLITDNGKRKCDITGKTAIVWVVT